MQLIWFIVQIITRAAKGLAITELELTTAALAGLNSVMYVFWWSKPRDVRCPVVTRTKGVEELLVKRTEDVQVAWSFSDREFDIREHLRASMTTWGEALFVAAGHFVVSLPFQLVSILLQCVEGVKTFPCRFAPFFSRVRGLLSGPKVSALSGSNDQVPRMMDNQRPWSSRKLKYHTKAEIIFFFPHHQKLTYFSVI